jgi:hypothetical protein
MHRGEAVFLDKALGDDDCIFEVSAFPRKESDNNVLAQGELTALGRRRVGDNVILVNALTLDNSRALVDAGALVGTLVLAQRVGFLAVSRADLDVAAGDRNDFTVVLGNDRSPWRRGTPCR